MNLNLHWGRTLQNKAVQLRHRSQYNLSSAAPYNYSSELTGALYPWRLTSNGTGNSSILHAENQFLKKSKILTDLIDHTVRSHSFTAVVTIASLFLFLTMTITAALVVFCKKKNTVFSLQKSEQEDDGEYELEDMPTDVEYTETDYNTESDTESVRHKRSPGSLRRMAERRTQRIQHMEASTSAASCLLEDETSGTSSRRHLVEDGGVQNESEAEDSPLPVRHVCRCGADPRGAYQRMVVTAILEKPHGQGGAGGGRGVGGGAGAAAGSESGDSDTELRTKYIEKLRKHYYALAQTASSDIESEGEGCPISKPPIINVTYVDDPPAYDCLDYKLPKGDKLPEVSVDMEYPTPTSQPPQPPAFSVVDVHRADDPTDYTFKTPGKKPDIPIMFVELPAPREKKEPPDGASVVFVELPPKPNSKPQKSDSFNNGAVRMSSTSVVMNNGETDVCLGGASSPTNHSHHHQPDSAAYPSMQLCTGSDGVFAPSMPLVSGSEGFPVPTLAIIPPTPMSDSKPDDSVLLSYIDEEEESDYNEEEQTSKCLIKDSGSSK